MSPQIVVDEQIDYDKVTALLKRWITAEQIGYEVGHKGLSDERIIVPTPMEFYSTGSFLRETLPLNKGGEGGCG
jgi:hypothetical protein